MNDRFPLLKFAVFAAVCIAFSGWLVMVIGNISFEARNSYAAEFADVTGLLVNDDVKVSGVSVGKVTGIEVVPGGTAKVSFRVNDDVPVTEDSQLSIRWRDVFGLRFLYLTPGTGPEVQPGDDSDIDFDIEQTDSPTDLGLLLQRLVPVMSALDPQIQNQVLEALSEALVGREQEVRELISKGASLTQTIASRDDEIARLLENSATVLDAYARREAELQGFLDSFPEVTETLQERNDVLEAAITDITAGVTELGDLVDRNDTELRRALDELDEIAAVLSVNHDNLEELVTTGGAGFAAYHYISRIGQWFNIRAVGVSQDGQVVTTERGASLPPPQNEQDGSSSSLGGFFGALRGGGR